ncbi:hypothetical protein PINS_up000601 [Pythium insidiosum]|nr:hypothetical protein PINS_up000601 [Pythium insidiosum]
MSLPDFFIYGLANDVLGIASNAHLAACDNSENGSFDTSALKLAHICSLEVDWCKNPQHLNLVRALAPGRFPDFMQNTEKPVYTSRKVLGRMFRRALAVLKGTAPLAGEVRAKMDSRFLTNGFEKWTLEAQTLYKQYKLHVKALMRVCGARSECELVTGMIIQPDDLHKSDYFRFGEQCQDSFQALQSKFRSEFERVYRNSSFQDQRDVAAAWYVAAYTDPEPDRMLSFPWINADRLCENWCDKVEDIPPIPRPVQPAIEHVVHNLQLRMLKEIDARRDQLLNDYFDRLVAVSSFRTSVIPHFGHAPNCVMFGSSALLLFEQHSDLDIMISDISTAEDLSRLAGFLQASQTEVNIKDNSRVPILAFQHDVWSLEVCFAQNGPRKTQLFRAYMTANRFFWPVTFFLVRWAKVAGLVRRRWGGGQALLTPSGLLWMFLRFCITHDFVHYIDPATITAEAVETDFDMDSEITFWSSFLSCPALADDGEVRTPSPARVIVTFFSYFSSILTNEDAYGFDDPLDSVNNTRFNDTHVEAFREKCNAALHQLLVSNGDINSVFEHSDDQRSRIPLSRALSKRIRESPEFFGNKITSEAGVQTHVRLEFLQHPNILRPDLLVADIEGGGQAVKCVKEKIQRIEQELGAPQVRRGSEKYHQRGCSVLLFEGAVSQDERIGFQIYLGERNYQHDDVKLHQAHLVACMNGGAWQDHAIGRFCAKFARQMLELSGFERLNPDIPTAKAIVRFGHHYLIHLPWSFHADAIAHATIDQLEQEMERGRAARELYESVLVSRSQKPRECDQERNEPNETAKSGVREGKFEGIEPIPNRAKRSAINLTKATKAVTTDRGVTQSFYSMMHPSAIQCLKKHAVNEKGMELIKSRESYQVSVVHGGLEFNLRLSPDLKLESIRTRPCHWFQATLKMHQELVSDKSRMDETLDVRYYVCHSEDVPPTDELGQKLRRACEKAQNQRGVLQFVADETSRHPRVRVSAELVEQGIAPQCITNARHVRCSTYRSVATGLSMRVQDVREYMVPSQTLAEGFLRSCDKNEVELVMPPLTPERRLDPAYARLFFHAGREVVELLRDADRRQL